MHTQAELQPLFTRSLKSLASDLSRVRLFPYFHVV